MDTSISISIEDFLKGNVRVSKEKVPPETWFDLVTKVYRHPVLGAVDKLFKPIASHTKDESHSLFPTILPHGITDFPSGIAIQTVVAICRAGDSHEGLQLFSDSPTIREHNTRQLLLILSPKKEQPLEWATWTLQYDRRKTSGERTHPRFTTHIVESKISRLAGDNEVIEFFRRYQNLGWSLINMISHGSVSPCARDLREIAECLEDIARGAGAIISRTT